MRDNGAPDVTIVDYGLGNLFSVKHAFEHLGVQASVSADAGDLARADAVVLPGVGAFGDAMASLRRLDLVGPLKDVPDSGRLLIGICLGMQLLMNESHEFGDHRGLGLVGGSVVGLVPSPGEEQRSKVPHVGWSRITARPSGDDDRAQGADTRGSWDGSPLAGIPDGEFMYFVHSYYATPDDPEDVVSYSTYGGVDFCSSLWSGNVFGCQFHPERSGPQGLRVYANLVRIIGCLTSGGRETE